MFKIEFLTSIMAWLARVVMAVSQFYAIKLVTENYDENTYSVYLVVIGLSGWFLLVESGMGATIQNVIANSKIEFEKKKKKITVSFCLFLLVFILGLLSFLIFSSTINKILLDRFFGDVGGYSYFFLFVYLLYSLQALGNISVKLNYGKSKGYLGCLYILISNLLSICLLYAYVNFIDSGIWSELIVFWLLIPSIFGFCFFYHATSALFTKINWNDFVEEKKLVLSQFRFLLIGIVAVMIVQVDYLILSVKSGAQELLVYSVYSKIYIFIYYIFNSIMLTQWSIFTIDYASFKYNSIIKRIYKLIFIASFISVVSGIAIYYLQEAIVVKYFTEIDSVVSYTLIALFSFLTLCRSISDVFATFVQSIGAEKYLLQIMPVQAILSMSLQYYLYDLFSIEGLVSGLAMSFVLSVLWYLPFVTNKKLLKV